MSKELMFSNELIFIMCRNEGIKVTNFKPSNEIKIKVSLCQNAN